MTLLGQFHPDCIPLLSMAVGVTTCRLIEDTLKLKANIKWVNDVVVNNKKVSGVLVRT